VPQFLISWVATDGFEEAAIFIIELNIQFDWGIVREGIYFFAHSGISNGCYCFVCLAAHMR
jgi:hypothetical protein